MDNSISSSDTDGRNVTLVGALVNLILIGLKLVAGIFVKSNALIADGVHSISDLFTDVVVLIGIWRGRRPPDDRHPFGHGRIEALFTAVVGISLVGTAFIWVLRPPKISICTRKPNPMFWPSSGRVSPSF